MKRCVIMSIYKNDKLSYLQRALESLYTQSLPGDIFVKIDGNIEPKVERFLIEERRKGRITYLNKGATNLGLAVSLNELIQEGIKRGYEYFLRMDADDIANPLRFEKQITFMETHKDIDICGTFIKEIGDGIDYEKIVQYPLTHEEMFLFFKKRPPLAHVSVCFRRSFFEKAGLYPEDGHILNEDTLMWLQGFAKGCKFANIDYLGVNVRVSRDFFRRRGDLKKIWSDFVNRLEVTRKLGYGWDSYFYALAIMGVNLLPPFLKKFAYTYLR